MRLTREPRKWAYAPAYAGHIAQGLLCGIAVPFIWLPFAFIAYQVTEFCAYWLRNSAGDYKAHDMVSRDIADFMCGGYVGSIIGIAAWLWILL